MTRATKTPANLPPYTDLSNAMPLFQAQWEGAEFPTETPSIQVPSSASPPLPDYVLVDGMDALYKALKPFYQGQPFAIDTETTGLNPHCDKLRLIQLATAGHPVVLVDLFRLPPDRGMQAALRRLFQSDTVKIFHNAKFDLKFLKKVGIITKPPFFDTQMAHQLLTAGLNEKASLKAITQDYLGLEIEKESQLSDWGAKELHQGQLCYAALDAHLLLRLRDVLRSALIQADLTEAALIEFATLPAVVEMEWHGMLLDEGRWAGWVEQIALRHQQAAQTLQAKLQAGNSQIPLFVDGNTVNLDSPPQLLKSLQAQGIPIKTTNKKEIAPLATKYPVLRDVQEYRKYAKSLTAFGQALPKHISLHTGRIHPEIWQLGTVSGRFSFSHPNLQQVPRGAEVRQCFVAASGNKLVIADYSQIELRIAAEISGDPTMIQAYRNGQDLHRLTASLVMGKPLEDIQKEDRQVAKPINFGLIYGMGAEGLQNYASVNYGVDMSLSDAKTFRFRFFSSYTGLSAWHEQVRNALYRQNSRETRTLAKRRRRWAEEGRPSLNEMLNLPVQGSSADITKLALSKLVMALEGTAAVIIGVVHDEIILECPEATASQAAAILKEIMVSAGEKFLTRVPVEVEVGIGDNWAEK